MTGSHLEWAGCCADALYSSAQLAKVPGEWPWATGFLNEAIASMLPPGGPDCPLSDSILEVCIHS